MCDSTKNQISLAILNAPIEESDRNLRRAHMSEGTFSDVGNHFLFPRKQDFVLHETFLKIPSIGHLLKFHKERSRLTFKYTISIMYTIVEKVFLNTLRDIAKISFSER